MDSSNETDKCVARNVMVSQNHSENNKAESEFDLMYQLPRKPDELPVAGQMTFSIRDKQTVLSEERSTTAIVNSERYVLNELWTKDNPLLPKLELQKITASKETMQSVDPTSAEYEIAKNSLAKVSKLFSSLPECQIVKD